MCSVSAYATSILSIFYIHPLWTAYLHVLNRIIKISLLIEITRHFSKHFCSEETLNTIQFTKIKLQSRGKGRICYSGANKIQQVSGHNQGLLWGDAPGDHVEGISSGCLQASPLHIHLCDGWRATATYVLFIVNITDLVLTKSQFCMKRIQHGTRVKLSASRDSKWVYLFSRGPDKIVHMLWSLHTHEHTFICM